MKKVECVGMVGKYPTPKGLVMFYDTGRSVTPVMLAEIIALQHSFYQLPESKRGDVTEKLIKKAKELAQQVNVYPAGFAALADDGRILVTEPWFEEK